MLRYLFRCFFEMCGFREIKEYQSPMKEYQSPMISKKYWRRIHSYIMLRSIVLYWMEQTQINLCKDGGKGRHHDLQSFEDLLQNILLMSK